MKTLGKVLSFILGLGTIIAGTYCLFTPGLGTLALIYIIGIVMIVDAVIKLVSWYALRQDFDGDGVLLFSAIISLILGIFLVADGFAQWMVDQIIIYASAAWVVISGILRIVRAFKLKDLKGEAGRVLGKYWWLLLIFGIALVALGIFMLLHPAVINIAISIIVGIAIIFIGANILTFVVTD